MEEIFGWMKTIGLLKKLRHRGEARVEWDVHVYRSGLQPGAREEPAGGSEGVGSGIPEGPETPRGKEKKPRCLRKIPLHA